MKTTLTPRARLLRALSHQEVDRAPIDLGGTHNSTMCTGAYEALKRFLGVDAPTEEISRAFEIVRMDEKLLQQLPVDTRAVFARPPAQTRSHWLDDRTFVDDWGITVHRSENSRQFDIVAHPLAEATIADLDHYVWPIVDDDARYAGLREQAQTLHEESDFAICGATLDTAIYDKAWQLRGMARFLEDLLLDPGFALALLEKVAAVQYRRHELFLAAVGGYLDVITIADDMGSQRGPIMRPALYRAMIKPFHKRYVETIRRFTDAKVLFHACGSIVDLVDDFIEIGVDALNPMQVSAAGMSPENLRRRFAGRMAFWGGIDSQYVLPKGSPDDVRAAVRETLAVMGRDGGYVLGAVHNIQDDVPPENVWAMLDEATSV
ncbi:MAG: hypothetical protein NT169_15440 [Chloroflexi bacterium]|nr:hypothetical protein [Chloroflexota bacterium]